MKLARGRVGDMNIVMTKHATERALEMLVEPDEIWNTLLTPDSKAESKAYPGAENWRRGRIALGIKYDADADTYYVLTCLWSSNRAWEQDFQRAAYVDRDYRPGANLPEKH